MLTIELTRSDLYPFCKKISIDLLTRSEVDEPRLLLEGKIKKHDWYKADIVYFTDDDGSKKVFKKPKKKRK